MGQPAQAFAAFTPQCSTAAIATFYSASCQAFDVLYASNTPCIQILDISFTVQLLQFWRAPKKQCSSTFLYWATSVARCHGSHSLPWGAESGRFAPVYLFQLYARAGHLLGTSLHSQQAPPPRLVRSLAAQSSSGRKTRTMQSPGWAWRLGSSLLLLLLAAAGAVRDTKYYDALGVSTDADEKTIQKAYRRQAL